MKRFVLILSIVGLSLVSACGQSGNAAPTGLNSSNQSIAETVQTQEPTQTPDLSPEQPLPPIPEVIIQKANEYVISQIGQENFTKLITFVPEASKYQEANQRCIERPDSCTEYLRQPSYFLVYTFADPEKPWVTGDIHFVVDVRGDVILEREPYGIPRWAEDPSECDFPIDESMAIAIAKQAGLEPGIKPWETGFGWKAGEYKTYGWSVRTTLAEWQGGGRGKVLSIDANSGAVLGIFDWTTVS